MLRSFRQAAGLAAFFVIGLIIWGVRSIKTEQVENPNYQIHEVHRTEVL